MTVKKLDKILLIDDSDADNFLHSRLIQKSGISNNVIIKKNGFEALDYLTSEIDGAYPRPELIFLDINMPGMNGWEFLEAYKLLEEEKRAGIIICMLTTGYSEGDKERAKEFGLVVDYIGKPLTKERLLHIYKNIIENAKVELADLS